MKDTIDLILEDVLTKLNLTLSDKKRQEYKEAITPIVETTIATAIMQHLTTEEQDMLNNPDMTEEEYQNLLTSLVQDNARHHIITQALDELVESLTSLPH